MNNVSLRLNKNTNKITMFNQAESLLDLYYNNEEAQFNSKEIKLESHYNTFYNLVSLLTHDYSNQELIIIANYIYHLKGSKFSLEEFNRFFNCEIICSFVDYQVDLNFVVVNVDTQSIEKFIYWYKLLIFELLFYDTLNIEIVKISTTVNCINELTRKISTDLINTIVLSGGE